MSVDRSLRARDEAAKRKDRTLLVTGVSLGLAALCVVAYFVVEVFDRRSYIENQPGGMALNYAFIRAFNKVPWDAKRGFPDDEDGDALIADTPDVWGHAMRYHRAWDENGQWFTLCSAGPDGVFDDGDDVFEDTRHFLAKRLEKPR